MSSTIALTSHSFPNQDQLFDVVPSFCRDFVGKTLKLEFLIHDKVCGEFSADLKYIEESKKFEFSNLVRGPNPAPESAKNAINIPGTSRLFSYQKEIPVLEISLRFSETEIQSITVPRSIRLGPDGKKLKQAQLVCRVLDGTVVVMNSALHPAPIRDQRSLWENLVRSAYQQIEWHYELLSDSERNNMGLYTARYFKKHLTSLITSSLFAPVVGHPEIAIAKQKLEDLLLEIEGLAGAQPADPGTFDIWRPILFLPGECGPNSISETRNMGYSDCTLFVLNTLWYGISNTLWGPQAFKSLILNYDRSHSVGGQSGLQIAELLRDIGWKCIYFLRATTGLGTEHLDRYGVVTRTNKYFSIPVKLENRILGYDSSEEKLDQLSQIRIGVIAAKDFTHMALVVDGTIVEIHWTSGPVKKDWWEKWFDDGFGPYIRERIAADSVRYPTAADRDAEYERIKNEIIEGYSKPLFEITPLGSSSIIPAGMVDEPYSDGLVNWVWDSGIIMTPEIPWEII